MESSSGKHLVHCLSIHITGENDKLVKKRLKVATKLCLDDEIPCTLPQGIQIKVNHGDGGGP